MGPAAGSAPFAPVGWRADDLQYWFDGGGDGGNVRIRLARGCDRTWRKSHRARPRAPTDGIGSHAVLSPCQSHRYAVGGHRLKLVRASQRSVASSSLGATLSDSAGWTSFGNSFADSVSFRLPSRLSLAGDPAPSMKLLRPLKGASADGKSTCAVGDHIHSILPHSCSVGTQRSVIPPSLLVSFFRGRGLIDLQLRA